MIPRAVQLLLGFLPFGGELSILLTHADFPLPGDFPLMIGRYIFPAGMLVSSDPGILLMGGVLGDPEVWGEIGELGKGIGCSPGVKGRDLGEQGI
jgi:hypothetical protein